MKHKTDMSDSMLLLKERVLSFCEVSEHCQLLQIAFYTELLIVKDWEVCHRVQVCGQFTLEKCLIMPGFDLDTFPFIVSYARYDTKVGDYHHASDSFDLLNVLSGQLDPII